MAEVWARDIQHHMALLQGKGAFGAAAEEPRPTELHLTDRADSLGSYWWAWLMLHFPGVGRAKRTPKKGMAPGTVTYSKGWAADCYVRKSLFIASNDSEV